MNTRARYLGIWELVPELTLYASGTAPASGTYTIAESAPGTLAFTVTWRMAGDRTDRATQFGGPSDGTSVPLPAADAQTGPDAMSITHVAAGILDSAALRGGKVLAYARRVVSADGMFMTVVQELTGADGCRVRNFQVYRRKTANAGAQRAGRHMADAGVTEHTYMFQPIGLVRSSLTSLDAAPLQGDEGGPEAWLDISLQVAQALHGLATGDELVVLTWLHGARRDVLQVHPRGRLDRPLTGVFATRTADRPNPVGLHRVVLREIAANSLRVAPMEAIDGTPVIDIKPVLPGLDEG